MIDSTFRVCIGYDMTWVTINEVPNARFDKFQMVLGPITLSPSPVENGCHGGSHREEEAKNEEGDRYPSPEARRLLQESEESRHAISEQRKVEVTAQTAPSHLHGDCIATRTHLNSPEDVS